MWVWGEDGKISQETESKYDFKLVITHRAEPRMTSGNSAVIAKLEMYY